MSSHLSLAYCGYFKAYDYNGERYFRLGDENGCNWYRYDFFNDTMQLLTNEGVMQFDLVEELDKAWEEIHKPKSCKFDLSNEEMFPLMMEAIKNRQPFDSSVHQPNSSRDRKFVVKITENNDALLSIQPDPSVKSYTQHGELKYYKTPYKIAVFKNDAIEIHIPSLDKLPRTKGRPKLIKTMLRLISEHFNVPKYIYTEKFNGSLMLFTIYKENSVFVPEKDAYFSQRGDVVTTTTPFIFNLPSAT